TAARTGGLEAGFSGRHQGLGRLDDTESVVITQLLIAIYFFLGREHPVILGTNPAITSAQPTPQHCFANGLTPLAYTHEEVCYGKSQRATPRHSDDSPLA